VTPPVTAPVAGPATGPAFRCSRDSLEQAEDLAGSASTVRSFLLLRVEGAWGSAALAARSLPQPVRDLLRGLERRHGIRPLLVRRTGRPLTEPAPVDAFVAHTGDAEQWVEHAALDRLTDLLDTDLSAVRHGRRPGWSSYDGPMFLVCTHGRHDACCAERGRPVWHALQHAAPEQAWQVSHVGGDRYAANVIVLPQGLYYGRMEPPDGARLVAAHREGRLLLDRLRGRTAFPFAVQAAEIYLRRALAEERYDALEHRDHRSDGEVTTAVFRTGDRDWEVRVRSSLASRRQLTCHAPAPAHPLHHQLLGIG
jgi:hypothetical protein